MSEQQEDDEDCKDFSEVQQRVRAPSKKKFEEEMELLSGIIRAKEEELELIKAAGGLSLSDQLKNLRAEKNVNIERRKKIDADLQKLNKEKIPEMMRNLSRLESTLHYRSEERINEAIRRLEWNMKVQNFRLSEEKKIVAEIDSLRRSKKTLVQYQALKREMDTMRNQQRSMREERDSHFRKVTQLKQREEQLKTDSLGKRARGEQLKHDLDKLYEAKRQLVAAYKRQREEFFDEREKRRHESFKKREEEKRAVQAALKRDMEELEAQRLPFEDEICLCNTLIHYLSRFVSNVDLETSGPGVTVTPAESTVSNDSSPAGQGHTAGQACGPAELEDGQYVLLRKSEEDNYVACSAKHAARRQRRSRKQSMVKRITHTPEVLSQFLQLNLRAPASVSEIFAALEQLNTRKLHYEREAEEKSEAELSVTESTLYEMSRQASHTESSDGMTESRPADGVMEQLLQLSDHTCIHSDFSDLHGESCSSGGPDYADCPEASYFREWHSGKGDQSYGYSTLPTLSQPLGLNDSHPRTRSEDSDSTPRSSSTVDGACGGVEESFVCSDVESASYSAQQTLGRDNSAQAFSGPPQDVDCDDWKAADTSLVKTTSSSFFQQNDEATKLHGISDEIANTTHSSLAQTSQSQYVSQTGQADCLMQTSQSQVPETVPKENSTVVHIHCRRSKGHCDLTAAVASVGLQDACELGRASQLSPSVPHDLVGDAHIMPEACQKMAETEPLLPASLSAWGALRDNCDTNNVYSNTAEADLVSPHIAPL